MKHISLSLSKLYAALGVVGSAVASVYGGWSGAMTTLVICMAADYVSGLVVAGVFHKSKKTETGGLESKAGWKGLCRKGMVLLLVLVGYRLDLLSGTSYLRDAICIAFICNEIISITENAGLMGLYIPPVIKNAIEVLKQKGDKSNDRITN